ncbi:dipeptidase 1 isoform X2 [Malaya genurostris]|uniref:dipeptidase 1 isoform X2 n=1 Tax=Malaya genurostris TaxID=325434 RepID=UPI0026F37E6A|nr:dipeptidase 1 isoform X2 [Malaya genurostris]
MLNIKKVISNPKYVAGGVIVLVAILAVSIAVPLAVNSDSGKKEEASGRSVLDEVPLIDGHNDLPLNLYLIERNRINSFNLNRNLKDDPKWGTSSTSRTDIPRLLEGKVGAQFWVAYVSCETQYRDAVERTLEQIDVIKRLITRHPEYFAYITSADGIMEAFKQKKLASLIAVEGGHSMDSRLSMLRIYYELGVRYMTLTHTCNTPWADASPIDVNETAVLRNVSEWGKNVIWEMNRLGMLVDISHVSHGVMLEVLQYTKAPVIFSHSSSHHVFPHHRNVQDDVLKKLIENDGIIMVNFYPAFIGGNTIDDVVHHLNYIKSVTGPDHIGLGSDFDGIEMTPEGLDDVSKYPDLFDILGSGVFRNGTTFDAWSRDNLQKLAGLNLLRVFRQVEKIRDSMWTYPPYEDLIPYQEFVDAGVEEQPCMSDINIHKT